jgi:DNA-binding MarR family transcriptional regulator
MAVVCSSPRLGNEAALNSLRHAGQVETTITALAGKWGWERTRASRALKRWEDAGLITRRSGSEGRIVITAVVHRVHGGLRDCPGEC